jgi:hypothetical protein
MLAYWMAHSSTLNMEATCSCETSVDFHWTALRYIPEDRIFIATAVGIPKKTQAVLYRRFCSTVKPKKKVSPCSFAC